MLNYKTITKHNLNNCMGYYLNFDQNKCMRLEFEMYNLFATSFSTGSTII